jgi:hypothetical protein
MQEVACTGSDCTSYSSSLTVKAMACMWAAMERLGWNPSFMAWAEGAVQFGPQVPRPQIATM